MSMASFSFFDPSATIANESGNLPHWRQGEVTYFVTFRTVDSIPKEKFLQWEEERVGWLRLHPEPHDEQTRRDYRERFPARLEQWLDESHGACVLARENIRKLTEDALRHFDGIRYKLGEHVVMANHVHALVMPLSPWGLSETLHTWKSYTSKQINRVLGQTGPFWQKESFDHIVRGEAAFAHFARYIRENPKKK
jgi:REP element-mobilizing transposase RayT